MTVSDFLIICSGANKDILQKCPTERVKFIGIGATIFLTAMMAAVSGGYAIYFVFNNIAVSIVFGCFWAVIIFNLDRYIVSSIKKTGKFKEEFWMALPRLLIALVLAISISKPLELRLFENRIAKEMAEQNQNDIDNFDQTFKDDIQKFNDQLKGIDDELMTKKQSIFSTDPQYSKLMEKKKPLENEKATKEQTITSNRGIISRNYVRVARRNRNDEIYYQNEPNQIARNKMSENRTLNGELTTINGSLKDLADQITKRETELAVLIKKVEDETQTTKSTIAAQIQNKQNSYGNDKADYQNKAKNSTDLLARLEALGSLKKLGNAVWWASAIITLLFVLLETAPVTVKLLSKRGPYDEVLDRIEYENFIEQKKLISDRNDDINTYLKISTDKNKLKLDAELKGNKELLESIAMAQGEIAKLAVEKWKLEEIEKLQSGNSNVIITNVPNSNGQTNVTV